VEYDLDFRLSHPARRAPTAAQELAFTLANGFTYVERGTARGLDIDFVRRAPFLLLGTFTNDFFEEIAKLRRRGASGRVTCASAKGEAGALLDDAVPQPDGGVTLTAQQPLNNIVRVAYQALAAVLGGTQSLHTNSLDETLALPTEQSVQVACARSRSWRTKPASPK